MRSQREKPWHKNASNYLVVNSILAAISALIIIQTVTVETSTTPSLWLFSGVVAMLLFIVSAEKITEAFSNDDVKAYVAYCLPYNIGVLLLFAAVFGVVIEHYAGLSNLSNPVTILIAGVLLVVWIWGWGHDTWFLLRKSPSDFAAYLDELEGRREGKAESDWFIRLFSCLRSFVSKGEHKTLPHEDVYTRLRPSQIHGVGVFAIRPIAVGTRLFQDDNDEIVWVDEKDLAALPKEVKKLYEDFAIITNGEYGCPSSFNRLTVSWYLNDSDHPNVRVDDDYNMWALRDIEEGEELTIDSSKFSAQPYRKA
jgi:hypothetical protein